MSLIIRKRKWPLKWAQQPEIPSPIHCLELKLLHDGKSIPYNIIQGNFKTENHLMMRSRPNSL